MKSLLFRLISFALAVLAVSVDARAGNGREYVLQRATDPVTGAQLTLSRRTDGLVAMDVRDKDAHLRKEVLGNSLKTTVSVEGEQLAIEFTRSRLVVRAGRELVEVAAGRLEQMSAARDLIARSRAAARMSALLGRIGADTGTPLHGLLLSTRMLLQAGEPDTATRTDAVRWIATALPVGRAGVTRVALDEDGPGDCWAKYAAEAIAAYTEYEDCMKNAAWYDVVTQLGCVLVYDMRALGAFSWWIGCVSFRS